MPPALPPAVPAPVLGAAESVSCWAFSGRVAPPVGVGVGRCLGRCLGVRPGVDLGLGEETAVAVAVAVADAVLVAVIRDGRTQAPDPDGSLEAGDELLFVTAQADEQELADVLSPRQGGVKDVSASTPRMATPGL